MYFQVDTKQLTIKVLTDPLTKMNNSSIWIDGKRRDRVTERYTWFDDIDEAKELLQKSVNHKRREISAQIAHLNNTLDVIDSIVVSQMDAAKKAIQQYNNESWG